jgi:hypothetical protein
MNPSRRSRLKKQHGDFWSLAEIKQLGRVPDSTLAKRTGRSIADIAKERQSRRIALATAARRWTTREIRLLGTMSDHELARRLRRTPNAVYCQRMALKVAPLKSAPKRHRLTPRRAWLPEEDTLLGTMRDDHLAQRLGCKTKIVSYRRRKLGIVRAFAPPWTAEQDHLLGTKSDRQLAKIFNRTPDAVAARRLILGISLATKARLRRAPHIWKPHELRLLGRLADVEVAKRIGGTTLMVHKKRLKLKIPLRRELLSVKPWTAQEDALVGTMAEKELARRLGRSVAAITHRRIKLGRSVFNPVFRRWTEAELMLLGKLPDDVVAAKTGHPIGSVKQKRYHLRLWHRNAARAAGAAG